LCAHPTISAEFLISIDVRSIDIAQVYTKLTRFDARDTSECAVDVEPDDSTTRAWDSAGRHAAVDVAVSKATTTTVCHQHWRLNKSPAATNNNGNTINTAAAAAISEHTTTTTATTPTSSTAITTITTITTVTTITIHAAIVRLRCRQVRRWSDE
jgi:hypothetical protein